MARKANGSSYIKVDLGSKKYDDLFPSIKYKDSEDNILVAAARYVLNDNRLSTFGVGDKKGIMQILDCTEDASAEYIKYNREGVIEDKDCVVNAMHNGIICISYTDDAGFRKVFEVLKSLRVPLNELGWEIVDDLSAYIGPGNSALVLQNKARFADIVMINGKDRWQSLHLCASAISRLFPWAFEAEPLTESETATLRLIYENKWTEFKKVTNEFVKSGDFYKKILETKLKGFANNTLVNQIESLKQDIKHKNNNIDEWYRRIRNADSQIEEMNDQLGICMNKLIRGEDDSEGLIDFLATNKSLTMVDRESDTICLVATTYLSEYDEDAFDSYVKDKRDKNNYIYNNSPYDLELTKKLYTSIWEDRRWMIRTYSGWYLSNTFYASPTSSIEIPKEIRENRIPQPHIEHYTCVGSYRRTFDECGKNRDYIGALNTIVVSSSSLNWTDSTVMESFMDDFWNEEYGKFLEDKDGNLYTVKEVVDILKEEIKNAPVAC